MLAQGFLDEVRALRAMPEMTAVASPLDLPAVRAVGYRQAWEYLDGRAMLPVSGTRPFATRQLAKRQLTWLRGELDARWFDPHVDGSAWPARCRPSSHAEPPPAVTSSVGGRGPWQPSANQ